MEGLPFLPGYTFNDVTRQKHHLSHNFGYKNGYPTARCVPHGIGDSTLDVDGILNCRGGVDISLDPSLTYGRTAQNVTSAFKPHFVLYDKKCLAFKAFSKQGVPNSRDELYRVRHVNVVYFLEDNTMQIAEAVTPNAGYPQGTIVRRCKLPKNSLGELYHWKDLNNGVDLSVHGTVYHVVSCDKWTREFLTSQGVEVNENEPLPKDLYSDYRQQENRKKTYITPSSYDQFYKFVVYDKKVLRFKAVWDDRDALPDALDKFWILFYLVDDTIEITRVKDSRSEMPNPKLMSRLRVPKKWHEAASDFPQVYLEKKEEDYGGGFYTPNDLVIGNTIFVFGRRFLIIDCDKATRDFYAKNLHREQPVPIVVDPQPEPLPTRTLPKYTGYGSHEDSIQSFFSFRLKPPKTDVARYLQNMGNVLRYMAKLDPVKPSDTLRRFVIVFRLSDDHVSITETPIRNSGFVGGKFLNFTLVPKPGTNPDNPEYLTPADLFLGATVTIFGHRFTIYGTDLAVFHYMEANPDKFKKEHIDDVQAHLIRKDVLTENVREIAAFRRREEIAEPDFGEPEEIRPVRRKFQTVENPACLPDSLQ